MALLPAKLCINVTFAKNLSIILSAISAKINYELEILDGDFCNCQPELVEGRLFIKIVRLRKTHSYNLFKLYPYYILDSIPA